MGSIFGKSGFGCEGAPHTWATSPVENGQRSNCKRFRTDSSSCETEHVLFASSMVASGRSRSCARQGSRWIHRSWISPLSGSARRPRLFCSAEYAASDADADANAVTNADAVATVPCGADGTRLCQHAPTSVRLSLRVENLQWLTWQCTQYVSGQAAIPGRHGCCRDPSC